MTPMRLEHVAPRSRVKHATTEPLRFPPITTVYTPGFKHNQDVELLARRWQDGLSGLRFNDGPDVHAKL